MSFKVWWEIHRTVRGQRIRIRRARTFPTGQLAREFAAKKRIELYGDPHGLRTSAREKGKLPLLDYLAYYRDEFASKAKDAKTRRNFEDPFFRTFAALVGQRPVDALTAEDFRDWVALQRKRVTRSGTPVKDTTISAYARAGHSVFEWAVRKGHLERNPIEWEDIPADDAEKSIVADDVYLAVKARLPDQVARALEVFAHCGIRMGELEQLDWSWITIESPERARLLLDPRQTALKGRRPKIKVVLLDSAAIVALGPAQAAGSAFPGLTRKKIYTELDLACRAAGVERFTPHQLRHTVATKVAPHLSEWELMAQFGWTDRRTAGGYVHLTQLRHRRTIAVDYSAGADEKAVHPPHSPQKRKPPTRKQGRRLAPHAE